MNTKTNTIRRAVMGAIAATAMLAMSSGVALASSETNLCEGIMGVARAAMTAHQKGTPQSAVASEIKSKKSLSEDTKHAALVIVRRAYDEPIESTQKAKYVSIAKYAGAWYATCLMTDAEK